MYIRKTLSILILAGLFLHGINAQVIVSATDDGDHFTISTEELSVRIAKDPWHISVSDDEGNPLTGEKKGQAFVFGGDRISAYAGNWETLGYDTLVKRDPHFYHLYDESVIIGESVFFDYHTANGRTARVYLTFRSPFVFSIWMTLPGTVEAVEHAFVSDETEHFFGLGECWDARSLDLKGLSVTMNNSKGTPDQPGRRRLAT